MCFALSSPLPLCIHFYPRQMKNNNKMCLFLQCSLPPCHTSNPDWFQLKQIKFLLNSTFPIYFVMIFYIQPPLSTRYLLVLCVCKNKCISIFTGVTILVSQTVLSVLIRRVITKTSEAIPLLGIKSQSCKKAAAYHTYSKKKSNKLKYFVYIKKECFTLTHNKFFCVLKDFFTSQFLLGQCKKLL